MKISELKERDSIWYRPDLNIMYVIVDGKLEFYETRQQNDLWMDSAWGLNDDNFNWWLERAEFISWI